MKDNREWVKVHLMCGTNTKTVTSVEASGWMAHDTNYFAPLVERTAGNFQLGDVLADIGTEIRTLAFGAEPLFGPTTPNLLLMQDGQVHLIQAYYLGSSARP